MAQISNEFLVVATGAIGVLSGVAAISINGLPKKGRNFLISAALVLTAGAAGSAGWMLAKIDRKPDCPPLTVPPDIDRAIYYTPAQPSTASAPGII